jgi:hypothetical protein
MSYASITYIFTINFPWPHRLGFGDGGLGKRCEPFVHRSEAMLCERRETYFGRFLGPVPALRSLLGLEYVALGNFKLGPDPVGGRVGTLLMASHGCRALLLRSLCLAPDADRKLLGLDGCLGTGDRACRDGCDLRPHLVALLNLAGGFASSNPLRLGTPRLRLRCPRDPGLRSGGRVSIVSIARLGAFAFPSSHGGALCEKEGVWLVSAVYLEAFGVARNKMDGEQDKETKALASRADGEESWGFSAPRNGTVPGTQIDEDKY